MTNDIKTLRFDLSGDPISQDVFENEALHLQIQRTDARRRADFLLLAQRVAAVSGVLGICFVGWTGSITFWGAFLAAATLGVVLLAFARVRYRQSGEWTDAVGAFFLSAAIMAVWLACHVTPNMTPLLLLVVGMMGAFKWFEFRAQERASFCEASLDALTPVVAIDQADCSAVTPEAVLEWCLAHPEMAAYQTKVLAAGRSLVKGEAAAMKEWVQRAEAQQDKARAISKHQAAIEALRRPLAALNQPTA